MVHTEFRNVTAVAKANVYFNGKVVSHTLRFPNGSRKTLGLMFPGTFHFNTGPGERMEIVAGFCRVRLEGQAEWTSYCPGQVFEVPANSGFDIAIAAGLFEYVCSFLE